jgi:hypothetical protein
MFETKEKRWKKCDTLKSEIISDYSQICAPANTPEGKESL